jgi:polysaccharide biosynthesis protein PslH
MVKISMKRRLLFISPVVPSPDGPGFAMRPYYQIIGLSRIYSIHLIVVGPDSKAPTYNDNIKNHCDAIDYICSLPYSGRKYSLWFRYRRLSNKIKHLIKADPDFFFMDLTTGFIFDSDVNNYLRHNETLKITAKTNYDRAHIFRIYLTPIVEVLKNLGLDSFLSLDIDDIESEARRSISGLYAQNGHSVEAVRFYNDSIFYFNFENKYLPIFDTIFTCSHHDQKILKERFPNNVINVLPNVVPIQGRKFLRKVNNIFTMLFVGTLDYYPNTDALMFFADQIVPILRKNLQRPWRLRVVGTLKNESLIKILREIPEIEFTGWVANLSSEYNVADIVVVPVRGGGGTRIKILEAFAYGIPVVSTSTGCYGLQVKDGIHLLTADNVEAFAGSCIRLMTNRTLGDEISVNAYDLAASKYCPEIINNTWLEFAKKT